MFKPEGLMVPDCECFKNNGKLKSKNNFIDKIVELITYDASSAFFALNLCDKSRDYYFSAIIFQMLIGCCPEYGAHIRKNYKRVIGRLEDHREEIEQAWDRIKPLVMQRIEYIDGLADKAGIE